MSSNIDLSYSYNIVFTYANLPDSIKVKLRIRFNGQVVDVPITELWAYVVTNANKFIVSQLQYPYNTQEVFEVFGYVYDSIQESNGKPILEEFPLSNIDKMREDIMKFTGSPGFFKIGTDIATEKGQYAPYSFAVHEGSSGFSKESTQEGLAIKTYQSDLFNNWLNQETIWGSNGINTITAIDTSAGYFS